jgi:pectate lyase
MIYDHVSASWGTDECMSVSSEAHNVTIQWCIISEGLNRATHGYGSLVNPQIANVRESWHHNLYAHHLGRTPRIAGQNSLGNGFLADYRNNITYNWGNSAGDWGTRGTLSANEYLDTNWVNNYAIAGTNSGSASYANTVMTSTTSSATCRIYHTGNLIDYDKDASRDGIAVVNGNFKGSKTIMASAFTIPAANAITTETADNAYISVRNGAGATKPVRDSVDTRVVNTVTNQTGSIITDESSVGGWPTLAAGTTVVDTDRDGMPDAWETAYGTNPNVADNNGDLDSDGYTNLEEYIHSRS